MNDKVSLDTLFKVEYGTKFDLKQMRQITAEDPDGVNFVSRSRENLGCLPTLNHTMMFNH